MTAEDAIARIKAGSGYGRNTQRAQDIRTIVEELEEILESAKLALAEILADDTDPYEYGTKWPLSEEAHGPGKFVVYPEDSLEAAQETVETDKTVVGSTEYRGTVVRRFRASEWEEVR